MVLNQPKDDVTLWQSVTLCYGNPQCLKTESHWTTNIKGPWFPWLCEIAGVRMNVCMYVCMYVYTYIASEYLYYLCIHNIYIYTLHIYTIHIERFSPGVVPIAKCFSSLEMGTKGSPLQVGHRSSQTDVQYKIWQDRVSSPKSKC